MDVNKELQSNFEDAMEKVYQLTTNEEALCMDIERYEKNIQQLNL